jgi:hypothetical protein
VPIDDRTSTQDYPKPNIANTLADDVGRLRTALDDIDADMAARFTTSNIYTITTTAISKTLANRERCSVTAAGLTITLPATPSAASEVSITVAGTFTDTIIARNGANIMSLAEDFTINKAHVSVTLYYVDATRGWRII